MSLKNRILSIGLSAAMLMTPAATLAESDYTAGELTTTGISDGYVGGSQINLSAGHDAGRENRYGLVESTGIPDGQDAG